MVLKLWGVNELPRLAAYSLGVAGLMVPFTVWLAESGMSGVAGVLWSVILVGGMTVCVLYFLDWIVNSIWDNREVAALNALRERLVGGRGSSKK
jgi:hypothetical protein